MIFWNLLYLNLAPYLFNSVESAYFRHFHEQLKKVLPHLPLDLCYNRPETQFQGKDTSNQGFLGRFLLRNTSLTPSNVLFDQIWQKITKFGFNTDKNLTILRWN